jgi:hypothetical protein
VLVNSKPATPISEKGLIGTDIIDSESGVEEAVSLGARGLGLEDIVKLMGDGS